MQDDIEAGRFKEALDRYAGDLLPALYIAEAEGFEQWLDGERLRLRAAARTAATQLTDALEASGDFASASEAAKRAAALDPENETTLRRLISLLDRAGDRSQAVAVYERFREHIGAELGVEPSAETVAMVAELRGRQVAPPLLTPRIVADEKTPVVSTTRDSAHIGASPQVVAQPSRHRTRWLAAAALLATVGLGAYMWRARDRDVDAPVAKKLVVLPMENNSGDRSLDYLASGFAEDIARGLAGIGGITIRSGARSEWPAVTRHDYKTISAQFGTTILLRTTLTRVGDSLEVAASVVDGATSGERSIEARRFTINGIQEAERLLAAAIAGAVFRVGLPAIPQRSGAPVDARSYQMMLQGWHVMLDVRNPDSARVLFSEATRLDPQNARAWSGLSSAWSALTNAEKVPFDHGVELAEASANRALALDSLQGSALANLGFLRALKMKSLAIGLEYMNKAMSADPSNPEVFLVRSALYRHAWKWDEARASILIAKQLDPLSVFYPERAAALEMCAGRPGVALTHYESELRIRPREPSAMNGRVRALALLGRYEDAIAAWRANARTAADTALEQRLARAHGDTGYWAVRHEAGRRTLKKLRKTTPDGAIPLLTITRANFAAGDVDAGYATLAEAVRRKEHWLYRLNCIPDFEEVRETTRFAAVIKAIGPLPER
jgi:tetratricopeptide (TPR) repeat protein